MSALPPPDGLPVTTPTQPSHHPSGGNRRRARRATAVGLAAGLLGGGAVGLFAVVPSLTSAAGTVTLQDSDTATDTGTDGTTDLAPDGTATAPDRTAQIRELLQGLVDAGTITADQADAVAAELATTMPGRGGHGRDGDGGFGRGGFGRGMGADVVADALGLTVDELVAAVRDGQTIAEIAAAEGVDVQVVIDAMVAEVETRLDEAVAAGNLTQDEADAHLATATEKITDAVQNGGFGMGRGGHGRGHAADDTVDTVDSAAADA